MSAHFLSRLPQPARAASAAVVIVALGYFAALQATTFNAIWADENVHLYVASRVADGLLPYRDVPTARPPLAILALAAPRALGIPPLVASRAVVALCVLATTALLARVARRRGGPWAGALVWPLALVAVPVSHAYTGIELVTLGTTACVAAALLRRPGWAGIAGGLALGAGQHAAVLVALVGIALLATGLRAGLKMLAAVLATAGGIYGLTLALAGPPAWQQLVAVHGYHLTGGGPAEGDLGGDLALRLAECAGVALLALAAACVTRDARAPAAAAALHVAAVIAMRGGQLLYVYPALPLLALAAALGLAAAGRAVREAPRAIPGRLAVALWLAFALTTAGGWWLAAELRGLRDELPYPLLPLAAQREMARLQDMVSAAQIAEEIRRESGPDETLFGHATAVAWVAVLADRRVAAERADLAPRWFTTGALDREQVIREIEADGVGWFVTPRWFYVKDRVFRGYLERCYDRPRVFPRQEGRGNGIPDLLVFRRSAASRPCLPGHASL